LGRRTLRAGEDTRLRALGESAVEERGEGGVVDVAEYVVGENVLLESLATVGKARCQQDVSSKVASLGACIAIHSDDELWNILTSYRCVP
jgi:hypothetical protein